MFEKIVPAKWIIYDKCLSSDKTAEITAVQINCNNRIRLQEFNIAISFDVLCVKDDSFFPTMRGSTWVVIQTVKIADCAVLKTLT
jgi:hypothetical protein